MKSLLRNVTNYQPWVNETKRVIERLLAQAKRDSSSTLLQIDAISSHACDLLDFASAMSQLHESMEIQAKSHEAFQSLYELVQAINTDKVLYEALKKDDLTKNPAYNGKETVRVKQLLLREFEWDGVNLSSEEKARVNPLQHTVRELENELEKQQAENEGDAGRFRQAMHSPDLTTTQRRELYYDYYSSNKTKARAELLLSLLNARQSLAKMLKFANFVDFAACKNDNQPEAILKLLTSEQKRALTMHTFPKDCVFPWDIGSVMKRKMETNSAENASFNAWFTVPFCIDALKTLTKEAFGMDLTQVKMDLDEAWAPGIVKLELRNPSQRCLVGTIYLDLLSRNGKPGGAAHYPIRTKHSRDETLLPISILSCNFTHNSHAGFITLLHEYGHVLHSVVSSTTHHHLSGTRGAIDFVEIPSILFEKFGTNAMVLKKLLPSVESSVIANVLQNRKAMEDFSFAHQIFLSLFDHFVHAKQFSSIQEVNRLYWEIHSSSLYAKYVSVPPANKEGALAFVDFPHLRYPAYAGSYYAYTSAAISAQRIWDGLFGNNPMENSGAVFLKEFLSKGSTEPPDEVVSRICSNNSKLL